ncbi:MAG: DUF192 domain-containing protein [Patescibacteria group bacterium]|nr:DUF192 domain-containing protein [Patescibacteria group bacterium]
MKKILFISIALAVIFFLLSIFYVSTQNKGPKAKVDGQTFNLEIAKTDKEKQIGLSKYKDIPQNFGMLFPFGKEDYYSFWMKEMKFSIDIIFIRNNKIVTIYKNVPVPKSIYDPLPIYKSSGLSDTVLEINAGLSDKYNFKNGDGVEIKL